MAAAHVAACIRFYDAQFQKKTKLHWNGVRKIAMQFEPTIRQKWPLFLEEMQGAFSCNLPHYFFDAMRYTISCPILTQPQV